MPRRLSVKLQRGAAMQVTRVSVGSKKLVYLIVVPRALKYPWGRSHIVYVGTTKKGLSRITQSVAARAEDVLGRYGVKEFSVRVIVCGPRRRVRTWYKLESALVLAFRHRYGNVPILNGTFHKKRITDEFEYFSRNRIDGLIAKFE
jgi:hypothetical protein